jgi:hypothetical protein
MKVLSFAAVGSHGREWWSRLAWSALTLAALALPASAQPPSAFKDFTYDLAGLIASGLRTPGPVRLLPADDGSGIQAELVALLAARGITVTTSDDATPVRWSCGENLRERACAADIGAGVNRQTRMIVKPRDAGSAAKREPAVVIELQPLHAQRAAMLDLAAAGDNYLVLTPADVRLIALGEPDRPIASQPIVTSRIWPRDLRGRLRVSANAFDAFLPGVRCRGTVSPFVLACADEGDEWPIGLANTGMRAGRNTFATPEGLVFYDAASIGDDRWVVVGEDSLLTLRFVDRQRQVVARGGSAEHIIGLHANCVDTPFVLVGARSADRNADVLQLSRILDDQLISTPSAVALPGFLTALWTDSSRRGVTAIVHNFATGLYEAFHVTLSCAR